MLILTKKYIWSLNWYGGHGEAYCFKSDGRFWNINFKHYKLNKQKHMDIENMNHRVFAHHTGFDVLKGKG